MHHVLKPLQTLNHVPSLHLAMPRIRRWEGTTCHLGVKSQWHTSRNNSKSKAQPSIETASPACVLVFAKEITYNTRFPFSKRLKSQWHTCRRMEDFNEVVADFESCPRLAFSYAQNQKMGRYDLSSWSQIPMAYRQKKFQVKSLAKQ